MVATAASRKSLLASLHCIKRDQGWDDATYRDILEARTLELGGRGYRSAKDIPSPVLARLVGALNGDTNEWRWVDQSPEPRRKLLRKIIVQCRLLGIRKGGQVAYVQGIACQMSGMCKGKVAQNVTKPLVMCDPSELWLIVAALEYQVKRQGVDRA
ncbi:hypothetical protein DLREEDagrD3_28740 [Denitratisoma sp. agr-D3]